MAKAAAILGLLASIASLIDLSAKVDSITSPRNFRMFLNYLVLYGSAHFYER